MGTLHEPDKWDPPKTSPNPTPSQIFSHTQSDIDYEGLQKSLSQPIVSKPQLKKKEQQNPHRRLQKIKKRSTQQKRRLRQQDSRGTLVDLIAIAGLVINLLMAFGGYLGRIVRYVIAKGVLNNVVTISPKDLNHTRLMDHEHQEDSNHSSESEPDEDVIEVFNDLTDSDEDWNQEEDNNKLTEDKCSLVSELTIEQENAHLSDIMDLHEFISAEEIGEVIEDGSAMIPVDYPTERPHVKATICKKEECTQTLLDTGCKYNLISEDVVDRLRAESGKSYKLQSTAIKLVSHTKHTVSIVGMLFLTLYIMNSSGERTEFPSTEFLVTRQENETGRILIGARFLRQKDAQIYLHDDETGSMRLSTKPASIKTAEVPKQQDRFEEGTIRLSKDQMFLPNKPEIVEIMLSAPSKDFKVKTEQLCHLEFEALQVDKQIITIFNDQLSSRIILQNRTGVPIKVSRDTVIGKILPENCFSHCNASLMLSTLLQGQTIKRTQSDQCFCQEKKAIVGLFTNGGFSSYLNEHSLTHEGMDHAKNHILYEPSTNRLFIGDEVTLANLTSSEELKRIPQGSTIRFAVKDESLSLRQTGILTALETIMNPRQIQLEITTNNTSLCKRHEDWYVLLAPFVWFQFSFGQNYESSSQNTGEETIHSQSQDKLSLQFLNNPVTMTLTQKEELVRVQVMINPVHQFKSDYLLKISQKLVKYYLSRCCYQPKVILSASASLTARLLHQAVDSIPVHTENQETIQNVCQRYSIDTQGQVFFINELALINEISNAELLQAQEDELANLDTIDQILQAEDDPLLKDIEQFPVMPDLNTFKNWNGTVDQDHINHQLEKLSEEEEIVATQRSRIPPEAMDNQSELSCESKCSRTPSILPPHLGNKASDNLEENYNFPAEFPTSERQFYENLLTEYKDVFRKSSTELPAVSGKIVELYTNDKAPIYQRPYPLNAHLREGIQQMLQEAVDAGLVKKVTNETIRWCSPSFVVPRNSQNRDQARAGKNDEGIPFRKRFRLVINFSKLNQALDSTETVLPRFDVILSELGSRKYYTSFDVQSYFHSLALSKEASLLCAFSVGDQVYLPLRVFEGLSPAPRISMAIGQDLHKNIKGYSSFFIDDHVLASNSLMELRESTERFLENCRAMNIRLDIRKAQICSRKITFLGYVIQSTDNDGVSYCPIDNRYKIFSDYPRPSSTADLYKFLGLCNFISAFVKDYQCLLSPFYAVLAERVKSKTKLPIEYDETLDKTFKLICTRLLEIKPLTIATPELPILLQVDSNYYGTGSILLVKHQDEWKISSYYSKRFPPATIRATNSVSKEILGILMALEKYKHIILMAQDVRIQTDCRTLVAMTMRGTSSQDYSKAARWLAKLLSYGSIKYVHASKRGALAAADALASRFDPPQDQPSHEHLLKYSFNRMRKHQLQVPISEGEEFNIEDIIKSCKGNPDYLKITSEDNDDKSEDGSRYSRCTECELPKTNPQGNTPILPDSHHHKEFSKIEELIEQGQQEHRMQRYTSSYLIEQQSRDSECQDIIQDLRGTSPSAHLSRFFLLSGLLLCRRRIKNKEPSMSNLQIILPTVTAVRLIGDLHLVTHSSSTATKRMALKYYYSKHLREIAENISLSCPTCQLNRLITKPSLPPGMMMLATKPSQVLYLDFITMSRPARLDGRTYKYILNVVDGFSGYCLGKPTQDMEHTTVLQVLKGIVPFLPDLRVCVSDNQTSILAHEKVKHYLEDHGIKARTTIQYASSSNYCEQGNKSLRRILRLFSAAFNLSWVKVYDKAVTALNSIPSTAQGSAADSPYQLFFKRPPLYEDPLESIKNIEEIHNQTIQTIVDIRKARYQQRQERIKAISARSKIQVGSFVLLLNLHRRDKQEAYYYRSHFKVIAKKNHYVRLENTEDGSKIRTHFKRLKLVDQLLPWVAAALRPDQRGWLGYEGHPPSELEYPLTSSGDSSPSSSSDSEEAEDQKALKNTKRITNLSSSDKKISASVSSPVPTTPQVIIPQILRKSEDISIQAPTENPKPGLLGRTKNWLISKAQSFRDSSKRTTSGRRLNQEIKGNPELKSQTGRRIPTIISSQDQQPVPIIGTVVRTTPQDTPVPQEDPEEQQDLKQDAPQTKRSYKKRIIPPIDQFRRSDRLKQKMLVKHSK